jgi:prepilin-type N-terminal cleavage/methylation domain-containing protein
LNRRHHAQAGFTLAEMLIAATLGAVLLTAAASSAGTFSATLAKIESKAADEYENALARIDRDVRYAWWVDVPASDRLQVVGPDNLTTIYHVVGDSLLVTRPDGSSGSILSGLASLSFEKDEMLRLRSDRPTMVDTTMASVDAPATAGVMQLIRPNNTLALGFMGGSNAGPLMVAGVDDRYTAWRPTSLEFTAAKVGNGTATFTLYEAFGPGRADPRPGAAPLASWSVGLAALPVGEVTSTSPVVVYAIPDVDTSVAIPALPDFLEPGVAYTLLVNVSPGASLLVLGHTSAAHEDQLTKTSAGPWTPASFTVPFAVRANAGCTTTLSSTVTTQVRTTLQSEEGGTYVGSACVYSQILAEDPWLGVVPGELPSG